MAHQIETESVAAAPPQGVWDLDLAHTTIEFVGRHLVTKVRGRFTKFEGAITVAPDAERSTVELTIDASSLDTSVDQRDEHLRSADFLDVEQHPTITFRSTTVRLGQGGEFEVDGELTIRGVTRSVTLEAEYLGVSPGPTGGQHVGFSASTSIHRDDFGANWNMVMEAGGLLVGKEVRLEFEVEAILRTAE